MNIAIIVAAGKGQRFASDKPKQFIPILGKPLIIHTLERFESCSSIDSIILVLSDDGIAEFEKIGDRASITKLSAVVLGGATRAESVKNGLDAIDAGDDTIVAVHDGARPLVIDDEIERTIAAAVRTGAACLVAEVNDTIKKVDGGMVMATIDRSRLRRALTPQTFRLGLLRRAFDGADLNESVTDECYLAEKLGAEITAVEGSSRNIKVTRPDDIKIAEAFLCSE